MTIIIYDCNIFIAQTPRQQANVGVYLSYFHPSPVFTSYLRCRKKRTKLWNRLVNYSRKFFIPFVVER
jgi:hypothetical protein